MELDAWLPHGLRLKQQPLAVGLDTVLQLVVPSDVDAVCDLYISRGALEPCCWPTSFQRKYAFRKTTKCRRILVPAMAHRNSACKLHCICL